MPLLVVQRGHVPRTTGATGGPGEQAMARRVAAAIADLMPHAGWTLRIIDADEPAARYRGDAFVALHGDASSSPSVGGASVGWRNTQGRQLGAAWKAAYRKHGWPWTFRADNYTAALSGYYGHRHAVAEGNHRAVIVEHGFMTNPTERAWIDSPAGTRAAALAVVEAVTGSVPVSTPSTVPPIGDDMSKLADWARAGWAFVTGLGILTDKDPAAPMTRQEFATALHRYDQQLDGDFLRDQKRHLERLTDPATGRPKPTTGAALKTLIEDFRVRRR